MTAEIFPGLKQPATPLFKALKTFISENGGAIRLAEQIENEWLKTRHFGGIRWNRRHPIKKEPIFVHYSTVEDQIIIDNYKLLTAPKIVPLLHKRSVNSINGRIMKLREKGLLNFDKDTNGKVMAQTT